MDRRRFLVSGAAVCACRFWPADGVAAAKDGGAGRASASPSGKASTDGSQTSGGIIPIDGTSPAPGDGLAVSSATPSSAAPVDAGDVRHFTADAVFDAWAASNGFFIVRRGNRLYAPSAVCTHQGALLAVSGRKILCARHGSLFDVEGGVRRGPARLPLPRYRIAIDDRGHVIVDTSVALPHEKWGDAGAYLDLP